MALQVLEMSAPTGKQQVTITSNNPAHNLAIVELQSAEARKLAIQYASSRGVSNARCEMPSAPYPVDAEGQSVVDPVKQKIAAYRMDVPISTGL